MKIVHEAKKYFDGGGKAKIDDEHDFLLFRQDFNGCESVYFNEGEIKQVINKIMEGEILIHHNYSILYCKSAEKMNVAMAEHFDDYCYITEMIP